MWSRTDRGATPPPAAWRWGVVAVMLVALIARLIGVDGGLWIDEIYSLARSFRAPLGAILTEYWGDNHHPLYAVLAHLSRAVFGESVWAVRLPAVLFGVAAVPALYALGTAVANRREALLASLLLAVSYHHVWFSQNARGYSAIACFAIVTTWALVRGAQTGRMRYFTWYGVAAALGAYTHLTMVFVVVGHALGALVFLVAPGAPWATAASGAPGGAGTGEVGDVADRRTLVRGGVVAFALAALLTLALYAPMLGEVIDFFLHRPSELRGVSTPRWAFLETVRVLVLGLGAGVAIVGGVVVAAGVVVGASGLASLWRRQRLFVLLLTGACIATVAGAAAARGTMYPRFFFFAIGPAIIIAIRGAFATCGWAADRLGRRALGDRVALAGVGTVIALSAASLGFNYRYPKQDFEGAMRYVLAERETGDAVVSSGLRADPYRMLWGHEWPVVSTRAELDAIRRGHARTWILWTFPRYLERHAPEIDAELQRECPNPRVFRGTVGGGDVMACFLPRLAGEAAAGGTAAARQDSARRQ